jgi:hypothetical protein
MIDYKLLGMNMTSFAGNITEYDFGTGKNNVGLQ